MVAQQTFIESVKGRHHGHKPVEYEFDPHFDDQTLLESVRDRSSQPHNLKGAIL